MRKLTQEELNDVLVDATRRIDNMRKPDGTLPEPKSMLEAIMSTLRIKHLPSDKRMAREVRGKMRLVRVKRRPQNVPAPRIPIATTLFA